jgi:hypothetical protein
MICMLIIIIKRRKGKMFEEAHVILLPSFLASLLPDPFSLTGRLYLLQREKKS